MSMETFVTVLSDLDGSVDESMFYGPWTEGVATPLFISAPWGVEITPVDCGNATILKFRVDPLNAEVSDLVYWRLCDIIAITPGL